MSNNKNKHLGIRFIRSLCTLSSYSSPLIDVKIGDRLRYANEKQRYCVIVSWFGADPSMFVETFDSISSLFSYVLKYLSDKMHYEDSYVLDISDDVLFRLISNNVNFRSMRLRINYVY